MTVHHSIVRILDASANRAREGLRVIEDYARFILDDRELSAAIKNLRHDLKAILSGLPSGWLEANRDVQGDVGTAISTPDERERLSVAEVVIAAGKRVSEALRSLEEYLKPVDGIMAGRVEQLRYEAYRVEQAVQSRLGATLATQWKVCVLISRSMCAHMDWLEVADAALAGGADCLQLREKDLTDGKLLGHATALVERAHAAGAAAVINDRPDIALLSGADGVHLGQSDLPASFVRKMTGRRLMIGVSTHNVIHALAALRSGADYCGVGPVFASTTKTGNPLAGTAYVEQYVKDIALPHLAIGGITPENVEEVVKAGARGIAVSACVCGAQDPLAVTAGLVRVMQAAAVG